jgi:hypothetical protein
MVVVTTALSLTRAFAPATHMRRNSAEDSIRGKIEFVPRG